MFEDLTGRKFGRLTVLKFVRKNKSRQTMWLCECECGNKKVVCASKLRNGNTVSCGCYHSEVSRKVCVDRNTTHGMANKRIYKTWLGMKKRCYKPSEIGYENYGGRGITVCDEWKDNFQAFYDWSMANGYTDDLTIDRKDNDGNYCPDNCRWSTAKEQANNKRNNHLLEYNGEIHNIRDWSDITHIPYHTLKKRINKSKWSVEKALTTPVKKSGDAV